MASAPPALHIGPAQVGDLPLLPGIESSAATLFTSVPAVAFLASEPPTSLSAFKTYHASKLLWVVSIEPNRKPVGFLAARYLGQYLHIDELSVAKEYQGQGVARLLMQYVEKAFEGECEQGLLGISLTTSTMTPWTWPWYERRGFTVMADEALGSEHEGVISEERKKWAGKFGESRVLLAKRFGGIAHVDVGPASKF